MKNFIKKQIERIKNGDREKNIRYRQTNKRERKEGI